MREFLFATLPIFTLLLGPKISDAGDPNGDVSGNSIGLITAFEGSGTIKAWNVGTSTVEGRDGTRALQVEYFVGGEKDYGALVVPILENLENIQKTPVEIVFWVRLENDIPNFSVTLLHKNGGLFTWNGDGQKNWRLPLGQSGTDWQEIRLPVEGFEWNPFVGRPAETQTLLEAKDIAEIRFEVSDKTPSPEVHPKVTFEDLSFSVVK